MEDSGAKSSVPEDSSSSDCFSSLDEGGTGDLNSLTMQQEGINSDTYDLDDLTEHMVQRHCYARVWCFHILHVNRKSI